MFLAFASILDVSNQPYFIAVVMVSCKDPISCQWAPAYRGNEAGTNREFGGSPQKSAMAHRTGRNKAVMHLAHLRNCYNYNKGLNKSIRHGCKITTSNHSRGNFPILSRILLSRKPPNTWGNGWFLKRTIAEQNGESTPRIIPRIIATTRHLFSLSFFGSKSASVLLIRKQRRQ